MGMKRLSISALLAGALVGLPAVAARAASPPTAAEAEAAAQHARELADRYRVVGGGVGYKSGLVQSADLEAARYDAMALELGATAAPPTQAAYPAGQPTKPIQDQACEHEKK